MTTKGKNAFDLQTCARPNILALEPYRCARDDYENNGTNILLDANENAYGPGLSLPNGDGPIGTAVTNGTGDAPEVDLLGLNRYPDPRQDSLKQLLCNLRNNHIHTSKDLKPENLFVGVGSDETIDALIRAFCRPGHDKILTCPPTYGMYAVSAQVNDVEVVKVPLDVENGFGLQPRLINERLSADPKIKLVYICSPGNPTGTSVSRAEVQAILEHPTWNGVVIVDEAYIDFAPDEADLAEWVLEWPNLVVTQTLSKAFGLAGIRLGAGFASAEVATILNNLKAPYNIANPTSQIAIAALQPKSLAVMRGNKDKIVQQRQRLATEMPKITGVGTIKGGMASNFLLVEMLDGKTKKSSNEVALAVYERLAETRGVVVRFRGREPGCLGCLRITVGTEHETTELLKSLKEVLEEVHKGSAHFNGSAKDEEAHEQDANAVVA